MKLNLSSRMFAKGREFSMPLFDFFDLAKRVGYDGIGIRPGQLDGTTSEADVKGIANALEERGLGVSFARGGSLTDVSMDEHYKLLDHLVTIGCKYVEFFVWKDEELPAIQKICDRAAERDIFVSPQLHTRALHDTIPRCLAFIERVDRPNLRINFDSAHLMIQNQEVQNGDAVRALADHIGTVCVQNYGMQGDKHVPLLPGDTSGVDFPDIMKALKEIGWDNHITMMAPSHPDVSDEELCRQYVEVFRPLMS